MELCLCPGLQSTMDEEREDGGPTSKTTLSGEHGRRSKAKRRRQERADSPGPSCVSMKSEHYMGELQRIRSEFVKGVSDPVIKCLLDDLWQQKVFSTEEKDSVIEDQKSKVDRARCLIDMVMGKGERASQAMIDSMKKRDEHLCSTLGLMSSLAGVGELLP
uniref:CARD domain-containing protein n=1 Tax=Gadus morhua TaxID=8049 RepID=A0A8C5B0V1_GADMO